jgi:hypothetical protein
MLDESQNSRLNFGDQGLAALAELPGLIGHVDQHAAAIRDALGDQMTLDELREYRDSLVRTALSAGWQPNPDGYDWQTVRIITISWLMAQAS